MPSTFILKNIASDIGGGNDFSAELSAGETAAGSLSVSVAKSGTEDSFGHTIAGEPGLRGTSTGTYSVEVEVITANTSVSCAVAFARINSAGTQQAISAFTASQGMGTAGAVLAFSVADTALGAWVAGDRLRVVYRFVNTNTMSAQSVAVGTGTANNQVVVPWSPQWNAFGIPL